MRSGEDFKNEIGGYLDISANIASRGAPSLALNAGRFCLQYIMQARNFSKIYLPYYGCHTLACAVRNTGAEIVYYSLNEDFLPELPGQDTPVLYINYYGIMTHKCADLAAKFPNLIFDNAQALYAPPVPEHDCFYSPRKFFALADGGYIVPGSPLKQLPLPPDSSYDRLEQLFKRIDSGAESAYATSMENRGKINSAGMRSMSPLTQLMFGQVDMQFCASSRRKNWLTLHEALAPYNQVAFSFCQDDVPLFYPFVTTRGALRAHLNKNKIYTPQYWPGVDTIAPSDSFDVYLFHNMHALPIDQRYSNSHMVHIIEEVTKFLS